MAVPVVTLHPDRDSYAPGDPVVVLVKAVDPDNSSETLVTDGRDAQNNTVRVTQVIERLDPFVVTRAFWERTGVDLDVDGLTLSGLMPSA